MHVTNYVGAEYCIASNYGQGIYFCLVIFNQVYNQVTHLLVEDSHTAYDL